ncbi:MAG: hypothetical protein NTY35_14945 [Planctomycetota bacterium]|nr:hypothetical protein [Planctomycetota bacterium]
MRSAEPVGHGALLAGMWNAARAQRLAHAFGFFGPPGVGKFLAAERLVLGLVCASGPGVPCLVCGACKRALAGTHPDVLVLDPVTQEVEEIYMSWITPRDEPDKEKRPPGGVALEEFLALRPLEGGWRAVLVREADRMGTEAQNALLKTLEEPGSDVLLVLESSRPERLLSTVRSRLVPARFAPLDRASVVSILRREGVDPGDLEELARWSRGAPGRALALASQSAGVIWNAVGRVLAGDLDPLEAAAALAEIEGEFPGRTPSAKARARARAVLDLAIEAVGDILRARAGASAERVAHPALAALSAAVPEARLEAGLERALEARQDVDANLDPALAVERVLLALAPPPAASTARRTVRTS